MTEEKPVTAPAPAAADTQKKDDAPAPAATKSPKQGKPAEQQKTRKQGHLLSEIVIRAKPITNMEDASTTTVITAEDVRAHSDKTLDDALRNVPGMQVETSRKGYVRTRVRGLDQDKLAILVDGMPMNDIYSNDIDISTIPVTGISTIIVNRGAVSALYGARGAAGIINVITGRPDRLFADASVEYGLYNNLAVTFAQGMPVKKFYYWLTGSIIKSDGYAPSARLDTGERKKWFNRFIRYDLYPDPANGGAPYTYDTVTIPAKNDYVEDDGLADHNNTLMYSMAGKAGYSFSNDAEAGISLRYTYKTGRSSSFQSNCISNYKDGDNSWSDPLFVITDESEIKQAAFRNRSFVWPSIHNVGVAPYASVRYGRFYFRGNIFYSYQKTDEIGYASTDHSYVKDGALADTAYEPHYEIKKYTSYGCNLYPSWNLASWNKLTVGALLNGNIYHEDEQALSAEKSPLIAATLFGTDPYPVQELQSLFFSLALEDEMVFWKRLFITLGISYDLQYFYMFKNREALYQYDDAYIVEEDPTLLGTRDSFNPVLGILADAVPGLMRLRASGSIKTRFPNLSEYSKIVDDKRDNSLKPERAYNAGAGIEFLLADDKVTIRADYFYSMVDDRIVKISGGIDPPVNIDRVESQGLELQFSYTHKNVGGIADIQLQAAYTFLYARTKDDTPEESVNKGEFLEYTPAHQVSFDFRVSFVSGTSFALWGYSTINQVAYAMRSRPEPSPIQTPYSTDYFEAVRLHDPFMLSIKISQDFLKHYSVFIICKNIFDDYNADPFTPGPGRMFYGGLSAKF